MQPIVSAVFVRVFAVLAVMAAVGAASGQTPAPQFTTGTVTKVDGKSVTLKTDPGQEFTVTMDTRSQVRRIPAGVTDLTKAETIQIGDVKVGDRVQARG